MKHALTPHTGRLNYKAGIEDALEEVKEAKKFRPGILFEEPDPPNHITIVSLINILGAYIDLRLIKQGINPLNEEITLTDTDALALYKEARPEQGKPQYFRGLGITKINILERYLRIKGQID